MADASTPYHYNAPPPREQRPMWLVPCVRLRDQRFLFYDQIEIGRFLERRQDQIGVLLIKDATISRRHCVITQAPGGGCHIRDLSTNGTWVDGRRLVPNLEVELQAKQVVTLGPDLEFRLEGKAHPAELIVHYRNGNSEIFPQ